MLKGHKFLEKYKKFLFNYKTAFGQFFLFSIMFFQEYYK